MLKLFYIKWSWYDLGIYIGGFVVVVLGESLYIVVGRYVDWDFC